MVDALVALGRRVTILDDLSSGKPEHRNPSADFAKGDVADAACLTPLVHAADAVIHLAAIASVAVCEKEPERAYRTNVTGTETVFNAAATKGIPVVYASSAAVYGDTPDLPLKETSATRPLGNYGKHKLENEAIAKRHANVPSAGLRFFNVYGPRQDPRSPYSGVISIFAAQAMAGEPLTFFGDGEQTRDFIYVGDVVRLIFMALEIRTGAQVFNGCTGNATSLIALAQNIGIVVGKPISTHHAPPRASDIRHSLGDPSLAQQKLGFLAPTPLIDGLKVLMSHGQ